MHYLPTAKREKSDVKKFEPRTREGIFAGYYLPSGGKWHGDYLVFDAQVCRNDALVGPVYAHRTREVVMPDGAIMFPAREIPGWLRSPEDRHVADSPVGDDQLDSGLARGPEDMPGRDDDDDAVRGDLDRSIADDRAAHDPGTGGQPEAGDLVDEWVDQGTDLVRIHRRPRKTLFVPTDCEDLPPVPIAHIDVLRTTATSLDTEDEKRIVDTWCGDPSDSRELSDEWTGETRFQKVFRLPKGYELSSGRVTRVQKSARPTDIWPELWTTLSTKQKLQEKLRWEKYAKAINSAREKRGIDVTKDGEILPEYLLPRALADTARGSGDDVPAMSVPLPKIGITSRGGPKGAVLGDQDRTRHAQSFKGIPVMPVDSRGERLVMYREKEVDVMGLHALVARSVSIKEAMQIPAAKKALDDEWGKLWGMRCWIKESVREYEEVRREADRDNKTVHFGRVFPICVEKHSELPLDQRKWKGRKSCLSGQPCPRSGFQRRRVR